MEYFDEYLRLYYSDDGSSGKPEVIASLIASHLKTVTAGWGWPEGLKVTLDHLFKVAEGTPG